MNLSMLKCKIHRATVTGADLTYEGSISLCPDLIKASGLLLYEQVDIYNCDNGQRFHTYVIPGEKGQVCLNGAAARLVHRGDTIIIAAYCLLEQQEARKYHPQVVFVNKDNSIKKLDQYLPSTFPKLEVIEVP